MTPTDAYAAVGLKTPADESGYRAGVAALEQVRAKAHITSMPSTPRGLDSLYRYPVPKLSPDGTCSVLTELDPIPYDVALAFGGRSTELTMALSMLDAIVERFTQASGAHWLGIYQRLVLPTGPTLVKLKARGVPSRAEFPLTADFAERSNNVAVALSGKARLIDDVAAHVASGGAYYECDASVRSEACLPIVHQGHVVGLLDAEHTRPNAFDEEKVGWLVALAVNVGTLLPQHP
jgi:L-methionine (R)-S-oxide reductase